MAYAFNFAAIVVVFLILGVGWTLQAVLPDLVTGKYEAFSVGLVTLIVAGVAELGGTKPRVAYIPLWLAGVVIAGVNAWDTWGPWGGSPFIALGVLGIIGHLLSRMEDSSAKRAQEGFPAFQEAWRELPVEDVWYRLSHFLIARTTDEYEVRDRNHNRKLLDIVLSFSEEFAHLPPHERKFIQRMRDRFAEPRAHGNTTMVPYAAMTWLKTLLEQEGRSPGYPPESEELNSLSTMQ